jgi:hypothetical protein
MAAGSGLFHFKQPPLLVVIMFYGFTFKNSEIWFTQFSAVFYFLP